ncbi:MAG: Tad domain-containing protein [Selenomonadaceae bacterium]|nr:Tad domain-containing protein [Selenomonadaceae bacterium]
MLKKLLERYAQRGQVLIFYGLMVPLLFCFVGAAADFGWLYFNQSRLQNAADAAVTAGAKNLIADEQSLSDYTYSTFIGTWEDDFQALVDSNTVSSRSRDDGDKKAKEYVIKNMSSDGKLTDSWNGNAPIEFESKLYGVDVNDYRALYYVVMLKEKINHLFSVMDYFEFADLNTNVVAVAKITHVVKGISIYKQLTQLRNNTSYATWDHIKHEYSLKQASEYAHLGVNNAEDAARVRSVQAKGNEYVDGNVYRTETLMLSGESLATKGDGKALTKDPFDQSNLDNLFVDFKVDIQYGFKSDWDWSSDTPVPEDAKYDSGYNLNTSSKRLNKVLSKEDLLRIMSYRIHDLINVGKWNGSKYTYEYKVREGKEPPDPLYVYIENENFYSHEYQSTTSFNTVRQLIINVNVANTNEETDRPIFFFYDGPEKIDGKSTNTWNEIWRESWKYTDRYKNNPRNSLPVIINLNEDFRGVFFFPNSPVVINGNDHNFRGIIVAEKFVTLKGADNFAATLTIDGVECTKSMDENKNIIYKDGDGNDKYKYTLIEKEKANLLDEVKGNEKEYVDVYPMYIDEKGNVQYNMTGSEYTALEPTATLDSSMTPITEPEADELDYAEDKYFDASVFKLASSTFDSFSKVAIANFTYLNNSSTVNIFTTRRSDRRD